MNKVLSRLIVVVSAMSFLSLFSDGRIPSLIISVCIGLFVGIGASFLFSRSRKPNIWITLLLILLSLPICYFSCKLFIKVWLPSDNAFRTVITKIFSDYSQGLKIVGYVLGVLSIPAVACLLWNVCYYFFCFFKLIEYKKFWNNLTEDMSFAKILKRIGTVFLHGIIAVAVGTLLLAGVYCLPVGGIASNVAKSSHTVEKEGTYPVMSVWFSSRHDNWTDSIMMLEAAYESDSSVFKDAMDVPRGSIDGADRKLEPSEILVGHFVEGKAYDKTVTYPRYWHGYLVVVKPLLELFDLGAIRVINGIIQLAVVTAVCLLLAKKGYKNAIAPLVMSYLMLMPLALAKCMQFSSCFYISMIGCLLLSALKRDNLKKKAFLVFLYCGIFTAYFDFLTYPIATFGVPVLIYLLLAGSDSLEEKLSSLVKNGFWWCVGYAGMWGSKWVLASVITKENVIANALSAVAERTSDSAADTLEQFNVFSCEITNYMTFLKTPFSVCVGLLMVYLVYKCVKTNRESQENVLRLLFPFVLVGLAPVVWYAFAVNHSSIHFWFTNKACVVSVMALLLGTASLLHKNKA